MNQYIALFKVRFTTGLQYRGAALAGVTTQFAWGFLSIALFNVFNTGEMSSEHIATFFWLKQASIALTAIWAADNSLFSIIEQGDIAYECTRPTDLYTLWFVRNSSHRFSRFTLRFIPIVVIALLLPQPYRLTLPVTSVNFLYFIFSLILTSLLVVSINMLIFITSIYLKSSTGIRTFSMAIFEMFDGSSIPYPFFSQGVQNILRKTFFFGLQTTPFFIYMGTIEPLSAILFQILWIIVFLVIGKFAMASMIRRLEIFGG